MPGGLIQLASAGVEDKYLTSNPEITYFSKIYRRYTNFSSEFKRINIDNNFNFNDMISITIEKLGDLVGKCFIEVDIPTINLNDNILPEYESIKRNELINLKNDINEAQSIYDNFLDFYGHEVDLYRQMKKIIKTDNLSLTSFRNIIVRYSSKKLDHDDHLLRLENDIVNRVNILNRILMMVDNGNSLNEIEIIIDKMITDAIMIGKKYFKILTNLQEKYDTISKGLIKYYWDEYFGLNLFEYFEIEIDGNSIERYTSDNLYIYLKHHYPNNMMEYIDNIIGRIKDLNRLDGIKSKTKIYIPLIFWFNNESINYLPLIALRYSDITIKMKVNKIENLLFFQDIKNQFEKLKFIELNSSDTFNEILENNNILSMNYDETLDKYNIKVENITKHVLKLKFPDLTNDNINLIFNYSSDNIKIDLYDLGKIRRELDDKFILHLLFGKEIYYNYNLLYSMISHLNINLLAEYIFLDEVEREKFAINKLEYFIDTYQHNVFDIGTNLNYDGEIDFTNPVKYIYFYFKPEGLNYGLHKYDRKNNNNYKINEDGIENFNIIINNLEMFEFNPIGNNYYKYATANQYLNNMLPDGVHFKSYCLYPEKSQPSGSINYSFLKGKTLRIKFNEDFLKDYYNSNKNYKNIPLKLVIVGKNYNILSVDKGKGRFIFG